MKMAFTDLALRKLPHPPAGQVRYFDQHLPAFGLTVGTNRKTFFVMFGRDRRLKTLGSFPETGLADARKEARRLLLVEPTEVLERLQSAIARYLEECEGRLRTNTVREYRRHLKTAPNIMLATLKKASVPLKEPHAVNAWRVFGNWCIKQDLITKNPFQHLPVVYGKRSRVLTDSELATIMRYEDSRFGDFLRLCVLTGQRRIEVATLRQAWIKDDTITIPASVAKNGKEHTIPFNLLTASYLPKTDEPPISGFSKSKARFDRQHPFPHWTIHDLRRTFATIHARLGTPIHIVEAMLNHSSGTISGVAAIYIRHNFLDEMRQAQVKYEIFIAKLLRGHPGEVQSSVKCG